MSEEVIVTFAITLKQETVEGFIRSAAEGLKATKNFPGCNSVRIVQHKEDPARFLFVESWASEDDYRSYLAWRTERGQLQGLLAMATGTETNVWPRTIAAT